MLNARGGIECDLTVTRLEEDRYLLVTGTASGAHDLAWLRSNHRDARVEIRDVTSSLGCLGVWGPASRAILGALSTDDLSNDAFPFMRARRIVVEDVPCLALRVTYVGELGWELYPATEFAARLCDVLLEAGAPHGLIPGGYRAIDSLRIEKGYRAWGTDITPEDDPFAAGLGFAVRTSGRFLGAEALDAAGRPQRILSCLVLEDARLMVLGNEPVFSGEDVVARVTSGGVGYALDASIAYASLPAELSAPGTALAIRVFDRRVPAVVRAAPLWDPAGDRIRA